MSSTSYQPPFYIRVGIEQWPGFALRLTSPEKVARQDFIDAIKYYILERRKEKAEPTGADAKYYLRVALSTDGLTETLRGMDKTPAGQRQLRFLSTGMKYRGSEHEFPLDELLKDLERLRRAAQDHGKNIAKHRAARGSGAGRQAAKGQLLLRLHALWTAGNPLDAAADNASKFAGAVAFLNQALPKDLYLGSPDTIRKALLTARSELTSQLIP